MTETNQPPVDSLTRIQILGLMGVTALILLIIAQLWRYFGSINIIGISFRISAIGWGVVTGIFIVVASMIMTWLWADYRRSAEQYLELIVKPLVFPDLIWVGLLPGLSEELLFRGVMIPAFGYDLLAIVISSVLFGILHLSDRQNWHYALWATIVGFLLGYTAYVSNNLLIPIVAHTFTNSLSSMIWKIKNINKK